MSIISCSYNLTHECYLPSIAFLKWGWLRHCFFPASSEKKYRSPNSVCLLLCIWKLAYLFLIMKWQRELLEMITQPSEGSCLSEVVLCWHSDRDVKPQLSSSRKGSNINAAVSSLCTFDSFPDNLYEVLYLNWRKGGWKCVAAHIYPLS